ncbi:MAG TPA: orotate phosphoribosyltransferase [Symbiobacteriaceae bacterium]|jgi:orotate phosphoribosyltransferase
MLTRDEILNALRTAGVLREGHFVLTSGRHSAQFFLLPHLFQYPELTAQLTSNLAALVDDLHVQTVIGPATGGIVLAYEMARQIGLRRGGVWPRAIFAEKTDDGRMALKRQWSLAPGERVLVVEDAVTTGGSVAKTIDAIRSFGPEIVGVACIADRSGGATDFGVPLRSLLTLQVESWAAAECPLCRQGVELTKPKG